MDFLGFDIAFQNCRALISGRIFFWPLVLRCYLLLPAAGNSKLPQDYNKARSRRPRNTESHKKKHCYDTLKFYTRRHVRRSLSLELFPLPRLSGAWCSAVVN
jgi:hypothetical protein